MTTEKAVISTGRRISAVWFVPLLALALGIYLVVDNIMTQGPEIEIAFETANGLEQGKTKVKFRDLDMGVVDEVRLNEDFDGVVAKVRLSRQALPLLREDTRFWVVTAQVGLGNITGLETLLSGAYIQLAPGTGEIETRRFVGLQQPPLTPTGAPGLRLKLTSKSASSVNTGDRILYKGYTVGRVESMEFDFETKKVAYTIFIDAPYHDLVNSEVRFWNVSGISVDVGVDGFKVEVGSLSTLALGGVSFDLPKNIKAGEAVEHNTEFNLYGSYDDILKNPYRHRTYYVVSFGQSIKGLQPGAPVEYRGIRIGRVEQILIKESLEESLKKGVTGAGVPIPVLIYIEPARLSLPDRFSSIEILHASLRTGVANGMRATLESGYILTGSKLVSLDFYSNVDVAGIGSFLDYPTFPVIDAGFGHIMQKVTAILDKAESLELGDTVENINVTVLTMNETLEELEKILSSDSTAQIPVKLNETLEALSASLSGLSPESEAYQSIESSLLRLNRTLGNLESVTKTLTSSPNALVLPSPSTADPIPEVPQ